VAGLRLSLEDELFRRRWIRFDAFARQAEVDGQHDEPLLGAVVEVALDPVQLACFRVEDGRPAPLERIQLPPQLAALGCAEQSAHHRAVESHDEL
jgi:hypothetical protein